MKSKFLVEPVERVCRVSEGARSGDRPQWRGTHKKVRAAPGKGFEGGWEERSRELSGSSAKRDLPEPCIASSERLHPLVLPKPSMPARSPTKTR